MYYRKLPVVIAAVLFDGTLSSIESMEIPEASQELGSDTCQIKTLEGTMTADKGDWIIRGVKGEFYPCKPDIFAATYELAEPKATTFGDAIAALKSGKRVCRQGWNGKGMYLWLLPAAMVKAEWCREPHLKAKAEENGGEIECLGSIRMMTADKKVLTGWTPNGIDALAEDWCILD